MKSPAQRIWMVFAAAFAAAFAVFTAATALSKRLRHPHAEAVGGAVLHTPTDDTGIDPETGSVRSIQGADIILPAEDAKGLWNPEHLERLARTYWLSLTRFTLGLCKVGYSETERWVYLLHPRIRLLTMQKPEYEMSAGRGIVRWRIEKGLLVAANGRGGDGYLEIVVHRRPAQADGLAHAHLTVEVANFYPELMSRIGRRLYMATQSRIHVIVTHGFLRSLARLDPIECQTFHSSSDSMIFFLLRFFAWT